MKQKPSESGIGVLVGRRLREIRKAAGLSLRSVSRRMAPKGKGYQNVLLWLEQGRYASPSIVLIADFLRACRAKFADIADLLEEYVGRIPKSEMAARQLVAEATEAAPEGLKQEIREMDKRRAEAAGASASAPEPGKPKRVRKVLSPQERVEQARRMIARRWRRVQLEEALYQAIRTPEAGNLTAEHLAALCDLGRRRFQILARTRGRPRTRQKQLEKEAKRIGGLKLPENWPPAIGDVVDSLFAEMERTGALDRLPSADDFGPAFKGLKLKPVLGAEKRLREEQRERLRRRGQQQAAAQAMVIAALDPELQFARMTNRERHWHLELLREMFDLSLRYDSDPEERDRRSRQLIAASGRPELAQALYERFLPAFQKFRAMALGGRGQGLTAAESGLRR